MAHERAIHRNPDVEKTALQSGFFRGCCRDSSLRSILDSRRDRLRSLRAVGAYGVLIVRDIRRLHPCW
jgi:hypothetical protein